MSQLPSDVGASNTLFNHSRPNKPNRSRFDLSRIANFTCDAGMIVPFDCIPTLPGDDFDLSFEMIMDTLPLLNPSLTGYKVTTHWYYVRNRDLWDGWQTFITRGRSGNLSLTVPRVDLSHAFHGNIQTEVPAFAFINDNGTVKPYANTTKCKVLPVAKHSLSSFLGVPSPYNGLPYSLHDKSTNKSNVLLNNYYAPYVYESDFHYDGYVPITSYSDYIKSRYEKLSNTGFHLYQKPSALPFMAYQNIVKYNYVNQNLLQENKALFPVEGDQHWLLPYDATVTNYVCKSKNSDVSAVDDNALYTGVFTSGDKVVRLDCLRYAQFEDDYFTTALPWLQRGNVLNPDIEVNFDNVYLPLHFLQGENPFSSDVMSSSPVFGIMTDVNSFTDFSKNFHARSLNNEFDSVSVPFKDHFLSSYHHQGQILAAQVKDLLGKFNLSVNVLREMIAMQVWQERNARVDGSYNRMIFQHWAINPRSSEHLPVYIGGTADFISFSTILQSSQSTDDSPLGSTAGRGSSRGSGRVGNFHCDDYGFIFGILIVKPNTTYMQGLEHFLCCENTFDDFPQPEFEGLSPQPILNKELYLSGSDSTDESLYGYQERYTYLKVRQNVSRGMFQTLPSKDLLFGSYTQSRYFSSVPTLSYQFLCMSPDNMRRDFLAYPSQPMFKFQTASKVFVTRQLAYTSQPNTFGF